MGETDEMGAMQALVRELAVTRKELFQARQRSNRLERREEEMRVENAILRDAYKWRAGIPGAQHF